MVGLTQLDPRKSMYGTLSRTSQQCSLHLVHLAAVWQLVKKLVTMVIVALSRKLARLEETERASTSIERYREGQR